MKIAITITTHNNNTYSVDTAVHDERIVLEGPINAKNVFKALGWDYILTRKIGYLTAVLPNGDLVLICQNEAM